MLQVSYMLGLIEFMLLRAENELCAETQLEFPQFPQEGEFLVCQSAEQKCVDPCFSNSSH